MRGDAAAHELRSVRSLAELLALLADEPGVWRPIAGGTDLMVMFAAGKLADRRLVDIWRVEELRGIRVDDGEVVLGALTTYTEVQADPILGGEFPMLGRAAAETGGWAIQNRGTLGGNVANASPAADSPPALLAYDAHIDLVSRAGARTVPYQGFHTGYKQMVMRPDEVIAAIRLPRRRRAAHHYRKVGPRRAQAISKVCFAGCAEVDADGRIARVRIGLGAVAPVPALVVTSGIPDKGALAGVVSPIDDIRSTARYRRRVTENLLEDYAELLRTTPS